MGRIVLSSFLLLFAISCSKNDFREVKIGDQTWASKNLSVTTFSNGDPILEAQTKEEWAAANENKTPAWCYYDGDPENGDKYGKLYNWYVASDSRSIAPEGWRVSSKYDFEVLFQFLGGTDIAGGKMKSMEGWKKGENGTNESGFTSYPSGYRNIKGDFRFIEQAGGWLTVSEENKESFWGIVNYGKTPRIEFLLGSKNDGGPIRLIKKTLKN